MPLRSRNLLGLGLLRKLLGVDGAGSGLDGDLLDGQQGSYYLDRANHSGTQAASTISGVWRVLASSSTRYEQVGPTTQQSLFAVSIAGGTLGTTGRIRLWMPFRRTAGTGTTTVFIQYGGSGDSSSSGQPGDHLFADLLARGATNAQDLVFSAAASNARGVASLTKDSTTTLDLAVLLSVPSGTTFEAQGYVVEYLP